MGGGDLSFKRHFLFALVFAEVSSVDFGVSSQVDSQYTHVAPLTVYLTEQHSPSLLQIKNMLRQAQMKIDKCNIIVQLQSVVQLRNSEDFALWESVDENGHITDWERSFFSVLPSFTNAALFVESLDWTIGDNGTVAIGYPLSYLEFSENFRPSAQEAQFYREKMSGKLVIGKAASKWTFLHEIGHAIMDLHHTDHIRNVMFPDLGEYKKIDPVFTTEQCEHAKKNAPHVLPIKRHSSKELAASVTDKEVVVVATDKKLAAVALDEVILADAQSH